MFSWVQYHFKTVATEQTILLKTNHGKQKKQTVEMSTPVQFAIDVQLADGD
jgi:hypothetical protein